jgi:TPR repeat protein
LLSVVNTVALKHCQQEKTIRRLLIVIALVFAHTAWCGDFEDGMAAYERKDYATAFPKFLSSAQQGNAAARALVGLMYHEGLGVAQSDLAAVRWYQVAAQQGHHRAQHNLARMYGLGQGVAQDYVRAHMWFNIAATAGDKDSVKNRDIAASKMTPQQIEQAQRMAQECMASNFKKCD